MKTDQKDVDVLDFVDGIIRHHEWLDDNDDGEQFQLNNSIVFYKNLGNEKIRIQELILEGELSKSLIKNCTFAGWDFSKVHLIESHCHNTSFMRMNFRCTKFNDSVFDDVSFAFINSEEQWLRNIEVSENCFDGAKWSDIHFHDVNFPYSDFRSAAIKYSNFLNSFIPYFVIDDGAIIRETVFQNCDLFESKFLNSKLIDVSFTNCDLSDSLFKNCVIKDIDLSYSNLSDTIFEDVDLTGACLYRITYFGWKLKNVTCKYIYVDGHAKVRYPRNRDFEPGEFQKLYTEYPTIEIVFEKGYDLKDHIAIPFLGEFMSHKGKDFGLEFDSVNNNGAFPKAIYRISPDVDKNLAELEAQKEYNNLLKSENDFLKTVVLKALDSPSIKIEGNHNKLALNSSTIIDNSTTIINALDDLKYLIENEDEDIISAFGTDKKTFLDVIKDSTKLVKEGALKEAGKKLMDLGINRVCSVVPKAIPILHNLSKIDFFPDGFL